MSATVHIERLTVGCDLILPVTITPPEGMTTAEVTTALTGATGTAAILDADGTSLVANASIGKSITPSSRLLMLTIARSVTADLVPGRYCWSVYVTTSGGDVWPIADLGPAQVFAA